MSVMDSNNIYSNLILFIDSLELSEPIEEELRKFSSLSLDEKIRLYGNKDNEHQYRIIRDNKTYYFDAFSSLDIEERDREHIKNKDYCMSELIFKTLEIAGYPTLINSKFIFAKSIGGMMFLIEFYKDGKYYIINLEYDLIMEKDEFYELNGITELKVLNKSQIYFLYRLFPKVFGHIPILYFILFYDELMPILTKYEDFNLAGYDKNGINYKNYFLFMAGCDAMFKHCLRIYPHRDFDEINDATLKNSRLEKVINEEGKITYGDYVFEKFSDYVIDEEKKDFLQTSERFRICHSLAKNILLMVYRGQRAQNKLSTIKLVNGKVFYQDKYLIYHSWVEFMHKGTLMVADLTQNLFMEKEMYYRYTKAQVLSVDEPKTIDELDGFVKATDLEIPDRLVDFFAEELLADFKKNEKILMINKESKQSR